MHDSVPIPPGTFEISEDIQLEFRPSSIGPDIRLVDRRAKRTYRLVLTFQGGIALREVQDFATAPPPKRPRPKAWHRATEQKRLTRRKHMGLKFIVQHGSEARPRNTYFVLGAYGDSQTTYVLLRNIGGWSGVRDILGRLVPPDHIVLRDDEDANRLLEDDWSKFCDLPAGAQLKINWKLWEKLTPEAVEPFVHGRVLLRASPLRFPTKRTNGEAPPV